MAGVPHTVGSLLELGMFRRQCSARGELENLGGEYGKDSLLSHRVWCPNSVSGGCKYQNVYSRVYTDSLVKVSLIR